MNEKEKEELYKQICNDINCGTYLLAPQYVDELFEKKNKKIKKRIKQIKYHLQKLEELID